jgi:ABC-2 type transport system ATP-binding protein
MIQHITANAVIEVCGVSRTFARKLALDNVNLVVPQGAVFGLIGENGAGKTTLIRHILGLLKPQSGTVRIFGLDPTADPVGVLSRLGTLSEDRDLPGWMRVEELMRYTKAFYKSWDDDYAKELRDAFELDPKAKIRTLSRGQQARAGLLVALAFRPELLVLDEPSSGLDPVVRRDILGAIIRTITEDGRTVLFSSHLLDEVERVSDHVAMIDRGKIVVEGSLDAVKALHHQVIFQSGVSLSVRPTLSSAISVDGEGRSWSAICVGNQSDVSNAISGQGLEVLEIRGASLDEIFVARMASLRNMAQVEQEVVK